METNPKELNEQALPQENSETKQQESWEERNKQADNALDEVLRNSGLVEDKEWRLPIINYPTVILR